MWTKVCGITTRADAECAVENGVSALGFIFHPPSPRNMQPTAVAEITAVLPPGVRRVGVFVDQPLQSIATTAQQAGIDAVQLHGTEPPELVAALQSLGLWVIKAFRVQNQASVQTASAYTADALLFDAYHPHQAGGTGLSFDWQLVVACAQTHRIILSGGLHPDNVAEAIAVVNPWGVDTSSGVETSPGVKDHHKIHEFLARAQLQSSANDERVR